MRFFFLIIAMVVCAIEPFCVWAEIYKFKTEDGNIVYTDDISKVPEAQRDKVATPYNYNSPIQQEPPINNPLSPKDFAYYKALKQHGLLDLLEKDIPIEHIRPDFLDYMRLMLKTEFGIDDLLSFKPDARLSSPEKTWQLYKQAFSDGDLAMLKKCLLPRMLERHKHMFEYFTSEKRKKIGQKMGTIQKVRSDENSAEYRILREEVIKGNSYNIAYDVYFMNILDEWRILRL